MTASAPPRRRRRRRVRLAAAAALAIGGLVLTFGCTTTITPPPHPENPTLVFLLHEAMHTGIVLPPDPERPGDEYVEFGYGDWSWYALGHDAWYNAFATVLWPTQGTLGRRTFGARTADELRARVTWADLSAVPVASQAAHALRARLQASFDARSDQAVVRASLGFVFVPSDDSYWLPYNCADAAAAWFAELGCDVGWSPFRTALTVAAP